MEEIINLLNSSNRDDIILGIILMSRDENYKRILTYNIRGRSDYKREFKNNFNKYFGDYHPVIISNNHVFYLYKDIIHHIYKDIPEFTNPNRNTIIYTDE